MDRTMEFIKRETDGVYICANDFFNYACADGFIIDPRDLEWVVEFCDENQQKGLDAVICFLHKKMPIKPHQTELFLETYQKLVELNPQIKGDY